MVGVRWGGGESTWPNAGCADNERLCSRFFVGATCKCCEGRRMFDLEWPWPEVGGAADVGEAAVLAVVVVLVLGVYAYPPSNTSPLAFPWPCSE